VGGGVVGSLLFTLLSVEISNVSRGTCLGGPRSLRLVLGQSVSGAYKAGRDLKETGVQWDLLFDGLSIGDRSESILNSENGSSPRQRERTAILRLGVGEVGTSVQRRRSLQFRGKILAREGGAMARLGFEPGTFGGAAERDISAGGAGREAGTGPASRWV